MKKLFSILLFSLAFPVLAHPSVSIVIDSQGNIFYSDLEHVWMIRDDGTKTIAVQNVHTHELWIGPDDALYGEDVTNVGENYRHRIWRRSADGEITNERAWRAGHPVEYNDYGFSRDATGLMYVLIHDGKRIDILSDSKVVRTIPLGGYEGYVHWLTIHPDGTIYVTVGDALIQYEAGNAEGTILAKGLIERTAAFDFLHDRHALMGLWTDEAANVYVSVFSGQQVKRISPDGSISVPFRQSGQWSIVGGAIDKKGRTLLLEFSSNNEVRVRRIEKNGETVF